MAKAACVLGIVTLQCGTDEVGRVKAGLQAFRVCCASGVISAPWVGCVRESPNSAQAKEGLSEAPGGELWVRRVMAGGAGCGVFFPKSSVTWVLRHVFRHALIRNCNLTSAAEADLPLHCVLQR